MDVVVAKEPMPKVSKKLVTKPISVSNQVGATPLAAPAGLWSPCARRTAFHQ